MITDQVFHCNCSRKHGALELLDMVAKPYVLAESAKGPGQAQPPE